MTLFDAHGENIQIKQKIIEPVGYRRKIKYDLHQREQRDFDSITGSRTTKSIRKKKKGKTLYRSQLDDDFDPEVLPWVETRRDKDGYILSWQEVFDEE